MSRTTSVDAPLYSAQFYLDGTIDTPIPGYTDGSRWNGFATPVFNRDTAMIVMKAVNDTNDGMDDQISISYDADRDAFLIHDPNYEDDDPDIVRGYDTVADGHAVHVYALGTRDWTWQAWEA